MESYHLSLAGTGEGSEIHPGRMFCFPTNFPALNMTADYFSLTCPREKIEGMKKVAGQRCGKRLVKIDFVDILTIWNTSKIVFPMHSAVA